MMDGLLLNPDLLGIQHYVKQAMQEEKISASMAFGTDYSLKEHLMIKKCFSDVLV